jgi:uncharacterized protein YbjT (DUF2867 family)
MIIVTSPTGNIGRHVVKHLLALKAPMRLVVRDARRLSADIRDQVEVVEGSHGKAATVDRAFEGADAVFWLAPVDTSVTLEQAYLEFTRPASEALRRHAVPRVVSVTALGRGTDWQDKAGLVTASIRMEDLLMATGSHFRGLAMPSFMDNVLRQAPAIRDLGVLSGTIDPDMKSPATATCDIGAVAARLLVDDVWTGQENMPVLGPEDLSPKEMAALISEALGREVRYEQISLESFRAQLLAQGVSPSFAAGYVDMMRAKGEGMDNAGHQADGTRTPTTFRQWCEAELKPAVSS